MPVADITHGMLLEPNRIFVMPPGKDMTINHGKFELEAILRPSGWPKTISGFLFSLAQKYRERAVAVILSGMDHDGSAALKAIKGAGGITFAQSNPAFLSMPRSAIETGYVDFVLPPAEIAHAILSLGQS